MKILLDEMFVGLKEYLETLARAMIAKVVDEKIKQLGF
jgi:hypothetical protein